VICTLRQVYNENNQVQEDEMGGACNPNGGEEGRV
jgi:hypothetical protein